MKIFKTILISFTVATLVFGCSDDFLEKTPLGFVAPETFLNDDDQAQMMLNGIYNNIDFFGSSNGYKRMSPYFNETLTDLTYGAQPWQGWTEFARGQGTSTSMRVGWKWDRNYQGISRANAFLETIATKTDLDADKVTRYIGEAKFLRAFYYLDLINFFGDVPLVLKSGDLDNSTPSRTPVAEVRGQMLKDLNDAISSLPLKYDDANDQGRITKGAAMSLKARFLLYNDQWADAAKTAKDVIDLEIYSLFPNYRELFLEKSEAQVSATEAIFEVFYTPTTNPSYHNMTLMAWWPAMLPTLKLANSYYMGNGLPITDPNSGYDPENPFMNRDPRLKMSIYYPGAHINMALWGWDRTFDNFLASITGFKNRKLVDEEMPGSMIGADQGTNKMFIRYGDVLLMYAEAQNEASGPDASVYDAIDQLRNRVGMKTLSEAMPGLSKEGMREVIRNERAIELVFEGLRINDIRRWRIGEEVMGDAIGLDSNFFNEDEYPGDNNGTTENWKYVEKVADVREFVPTRDYLWPIPQNEMDANPNMVQNPGYN